MSSNKPANEYLTRARSQRLESLLDMYSRGVITLADFIRLKSEIKVPIQSKPAAAEPEPPKSGSTK